MAVAAEQPPDRRRVHDLAHDGARRAVDRL
jgi:hypothetical protein